MLQTDASSGRTKARVIGHYGSLFRVFIGARRHLTREWEIAATQATDGIFVNGLGRAVCISLGRAAMRAVGRRRQALRVGELQSDTSEAFDSVLRSALGERGVGASSGTEQPEPLTGLPVADGGRGKAGA